MYGLTRGALTLIGAAVAGVLLWLGADVVSDNGSLSSGEHWLTAGLVAAAGLTMALSQLLGGWTKWGWPRVSGNVFLIAFLPVLLVGGWILAVGEPGEHWLGDHVRGWSDDMGIEGLVGDLTVMIPAIAFGIGLVFGLTFDTTGPRARERVVAPAGAQEQTRVAPEPAPDDERRVHIRGGEDPDTVPAGVSSPKPEKSPET